MHPLGVGVLLIGGPVFAPIFGVLHRAGNGILTIAKGTLPLVLFGSSGNGVRQGWMMVPARVAQALAPCLFGIVLDRLHGGALWVTAGIGVAAFAALLALRTEMPTEPGLSAAQTARCRWCASDSPLRPLGGRRASGSWPPLRDVRHRHNGKSACQ